LVAASLSAPCQGVPVFDAKVLQHGIDAFDAAHPTISRDIFDKDIFYKNLKKSPARSISS
jgi:hypothetical protein